MNVSGLCTTIPDEDAVLYRWTYNQGPKAERIVSVYSLFMLKKAEGVVQQEAEKWCTDKCDGNRFWKLSDIMWFCLECEFWYHYSCCEIQSSKKSYTQLEDFVKMPLLKGGPFGPVGTAPLAFSATRTMEKIRVEGGDTDNDWRELLDEDFGRSSDDFLEQKKRVASGPLTSFVGCPQCHKEI